MRSWLRKELGWFVLAVTLLALPGPASTACACARMKADAQAASVSRGAKKECPRCQRVTTTQSNAGGKSRIARPSCCRSKVSDAHAAETPVKVQLERHETRTLLPAAVTPSPATRKSGVRGTRAPPSRGVRDAGAPPASYLSDYLRL